MKNLLLILVSLCIISCAQFENRKKERELQTQILNKLNEKTSLFSQCTKKAKIFDLFKNERIRVVLNISINSNGEVEKFKLDNKNYPEDYSMCMYNIVDLISFPKIDKHELIVLKQPFIFRK